MSVADLPDRMHGVADLTVVESQSQVCRNVDTPDETVEYLRVYDVFIEFDLASLCFLLCMLAIYPYKPVHH